MDALRTILPSSISSLVSSSLGGGGNGLSDTLKLVVIGGTMEAARRGSVSAWNGFVDSFFLTAHFSQEDYPYDWLMHWLSKQPAYSRSREFEITTRSASRGFVSSLAQDDLDEDETDDVEEGETKLVHGRKKRKVAFLPSMETTHTIYYRGHWLRITRSKASSGHYSGYASLKISVVARNNSILKKLVAEAKRDYERDSEERVHIFLGDTTYGHWRWNGARQKRPMSSIVLEKGVKDMLLNDCKDFLGSEEWYAERGIPFRRGYLLHGVPGSGKTSLIHALAGTLGLDIYVVSLSSKGMSDNSLATLMGNVPTRCIVLLEDLDAAFTRGVNRDDASTGAPTSTTTTKEEKKDEAKDDNGSTLSLSGLLNALDGVAASEGRLLFATTNHIERLDPALSRPGRMDVWVNFGWATRWQAEGIFRCFFPAVAASASADETPVDASPVNGTANIASGPAKTRKIKKASAPALTTEELDKLAKEFAAAIPEDELSVASLQGYLLKNKTRPRECVQEVEKWIQEERVSREKIKKEKEKAKKEKEEKEKEEKEKAEKEKKADDAEKKDDTTKTEEASKTKEDAAAAPVTPEKEEEIDIDKFIVVSKPCSCSSSTAPATPVEPAATSTEPAAAPAEATVEASSPTPEPTLPATVEEKVATTNDSGKVDDKKDA